MEQDEVQKLIDDSVKTAVVPLQDKDTQLEYRLNTHKHTQADLTQKLNVVVSTPVALTDAATIATDATKGDWFYVTLGGNRTLGNPTGAVDGQKITFELIQDATGSRTITLDTKFQLGVGLSAIVLTTTANKRDFMLAMYRSTTDKFYVTSFADGY